MKKLLSGLLLTSLVVVLPAYADIAADKMAAAKLTISANLKKVNPGYGVDSIKPSGVPGYYRVQITNGPAVYISETGDHLFDGELYHIGAGKLINLTEQQAAVERKVLMAEFKPEEMIIFSPKPPMAVKTYMTVFTDVDCGYCQKLHQDVPALNAKGVEVRYMAFPRAGLGSSSYKKLVTAWCSPNKQEAITMLKSHQQLAELTCDNPVAKQYDLGKRMGISGTPAIILKDGTLVPGYRPVADMLKVLGI